MFRIPGVLLLLTLIGILFLSTPSRRVINHYPDSVHRWRQSDCAAYTKTFYRNKTGLLTPGTFNLAGKQGRVASEFPIIYYLSAQLETVVGEHYWVNRSLNFLLYFLGLWALYAALVRFFFKGNRLVVLGVVALLAASPFYYYYALNFLPNVPAISLSLVGFYFLCAFHERRSWWALVLATLAMSVAMLLKPTDGGLLLGAYGLMLLTLFFRKHSFRKAAIGYWLLLLLAVSVIMVVNLLWVRYVNAYNDLNGNHQNLLSIYPIWDMEKDIRNYTFKRSLTIWSPDFQHPVILLTIPVLFGLFIWKWRSLNARLKWLTLYLILLGCTYTIFWFKAYDVHDYYHLPLVLPVVFLAATIAEYLCRAVQVPARRNYAVGLSAGLGALVLLAIYQNRQVQQRRYNLPNDLHPVPELYQSEAYLNSIGVTPDQQVVCVPDKSPNISLNAINRYGYTEEFNTPTYNINTFKWQGASYLILLDSAYLKDPLYEPYIHHQIGQFGRVLVFDIR